MEYILVQSFFVFLLMVDTCGADTQSDSWKDMLRGYLSGQLSSSYHTEAFRHEFRKFINIVDKKMKTWKEEIKSKPVIHGRNKSIVYTRWGKKSCPSNAELVYSGFMGGSSYAHTGAVVDSLCLPRDPESGIHNDRAGTPRNYVYGTEYEIYHFSNHIDKLVKHDVPCAVCLVKNRSI
ncbi:uncharacterized protein LOC125672888 [Ostrea edulis]|uniref:uncharacterized protein LOC125672888 n=1 Tax=Ostrea edulis TaxID=37623 RepID=UPI0024AF9D35|nr:uncharacterized protein LOC125672888 [Ostrea edulis]